MLKKIKPKILKLSLAIGAKKRTRLLDRVGHLVFIISFLSLAIYHSPFAIRPAFASEVSLSIAPPLIQIEAIPPADVTTPLIIENKGDQTVEVQILFKPFKADETANGQIKYLDEKEIIASPDKNILQKIQIIDNDAAVKNFELGPKQEKNLQVHVGVPAKEPYADYYYSIVFLASPPQADKPAQNAKDANNSNAQTGIAANLILSIGPKDNPKGYIQEFSAPPLLESGPVPFTIKVQNAGSHVITPKGMILIKNMFGQIIGRIDLAPSNILAGSQRSLFALPQNKKANIEFDLDHPQAIWPEKVLFGPYTATLNLAISEKGPLYTRSLHFFVAPIQVVIGFIVSLCLITMMYIRIRAKLKENK